MRLTSFFLLITTFIMLASCSKREAALRLNGSLADSLSLRVALMPVEDCLPVYYAQSMGIFDSCGLTVRIEEFLSQMDCDTALMLQRADVGYTCMQRIVVGESLGDTLIPHFCTSGRMVLVSGKSKRLTKTAQLKDRIVAVERNSPADQWSDQIVSEAELEQTDIYRVQINDIQLRTSMLMQQLVDAAILPEPYATRARMSGNRSLKTYADTLRYNCWASPKRIMADAGKQAQIALFREAYERAAKVLSEGNANADTLRVILLRHFALDEATADTFKIKTSIVQQADFNPLRTATKAWLKTREIPHD